MNLVPCRVRGIPGFIMRTDQNEAGTGHHPHTVIEVAAAVRDCDASDWGTAAKWSLRWRTEART
jgi:hypothetical protein